jgi:hypothetical protein
VPVVQARVDNSGNPVGAFRYVSHYPLFLGAGDYTIGGFYPRKEKSKDVDPIAIAFRNVATAPGVTFEGRSQHLRIEVSHR